MGLAKKIQKTFLAGFDFSFPNCKSKALKSFLPEVHEDEYGEEERYDGDGVAQYPDVHLPVRDVPLVLGDAVAARVVQAAVVVGEVVPGPVL